MYTQSSIVKYKNMACVVLLVWGNQTILSPLCSEEQFVVEQRNIAGVIMNPNPAPIGGPNG